MIGLIDRFETSKEISILQSIEQQCAKDLLDDKGGLIFEFNKIDQSLFGLVFLRLFSVTANRKYLNAANEIYESVCSDFLLNERQLLMYRKEHHVCFVDAIGMVCPFLYLYSEVCESSEALALANKQIEFYIDNAFEKDSNLPFHAFDLENGLKIGPVNWSRGVGWFLIGLAYALKQLDLNSPDRDRFNDLFDTINRKLDALRIEGVFWPQFFGHTNDESIDTSSTLMIYYSRLTAAKSVDTKNLNAVLKKSLDKQGFITKSTGDTIYINKYSRHKGRSEITQGILVSILSRNSEL